MKIRFWGVRGSLPSALSIEDYFEKVRKICAKGEFTPLPVEFDVNEADVYNRIAPVGFPLGGNTSCVEVSDEEDFFIFDAGSGLRPLGVDTVKRKRHFTENPLHLFISHFHWDHIQGVPFFKPAYVKGNRIEVLSGFENAKDLLTAQQQPPFFPVPFEKLGASFTFKHLVPQEPVYVGEVKVEVLRMVHPNDCYGVSLEKDRTKIAYMTDTEIAQSDEQMIGRYQDFVRGCDVIIVDSQYSLLDSIKKIQWGHSSILPFVDVFKDCDIKKIVLFHYDPYYSDDYILSLLEEARAILKNFDRPHTEIIPSFEGLVLNI